MKNFRLNIIDSIRFLIYDELSLKITKLLLLIVIPVAILLWIISVIIASVAYSETLSENQDTPSTVEEQRRCLTLGSISLSSLIIQFIGLIGVIKEKKVITAIASLEILFDLIAHLAVLDYKSDLIIFIDFILEILIIFYTIKLKFKNEMFTEI